ncbi:DUF3097 domain-containing protein [Sporichthya brevicatena]|uniref:DUF3097 domain-containing protein n=2 Tax=Sporichthya brevicatena TaxID=171442 RepID=A0ABN1H073_9ACTN
MRSNMPGDHYGADVLARNWRRPRAVPAVPADRDLVVEEVDTGFCGAVVRCDKMPGGWVVTLADRHDKHRTFPLGPGFLIDGKPVTLTPPSAPAAAKVPARTASGSVAVPRARARVARASRIYVEGRHDAELVEKVWGDDLRHEGVVVEYLEGVDDLPAIVAEFRPAPGRRLGVLVDHLVEGSKESRIAAAVRNPHVLVVGHPYIDIWQAVRPQVVRIDAWPDVPRGRPWKEGVIDALGWNCETHVAWKRILASVRTWTDLEPALLGRVEELIDFVTTGDAAEGAAED